MSEPNGVAKAANLTTIIVSSVATFAFCGAGCLALVTFKVAPLEAAIETNSRIIGEVKAEGTDAVQREIARNNEYGERIAATEAQVGLFRDLFLSGKLRLE